MTSEMTTLKGKPFQRAELDSLLRRNLFYTPSFEIYGGVSGFYDYGPPGCALNANILNLWRRHFVQEENMLELEYECHPSLPMAVGRVLIVVLLPSLGYPSLPHMKFCKPPDTSIAFVVRPDLVVLHRYIGRGKADRV